MSDKDQTVWRREDESSRGPLYSDGSPSGIAEVGTKDRRGGGCIRGAPMMGFTSCCLVASRSATGNVRCSDFAGVQIPIP